MTKLEAVNTLLAIIGETPITTLSPTQGTTADVDIALECLDEACKSVQSTEYQFGFERNYTLPVDSITKEITVPKSFLSFYPYNPNIASRGDRLYDLKNHTYKFNTNVIGDAVIYLEFQNVPDDIYQRYITYVAAEAFITRTTPSDSLLQTVLKKQADIKGEIERREARLYRCNMLNNVSVNNTWNYKQSILRFTNPFDL